MQLYKLPRNTLFRVLYKDDPRLSNIQYLLHNIDGMYSYCTDDANNVYHFAAWTEVEIVTDVK